MLKKTAIITALGAFGAVLAVLFPEYTGAFCAGKFGGW